MRLSNRHIHKLRHSHHTLTSHAHVHLRYAPITHCGSAYTTHTNRQQSHFPIHIPLHSFCTQTASGSKPQSDSSTDSNVNIPITGNATKVSPNDDDKPRLKLTLKDTLDTIRTGRIGGTELKRLYDFTKPEAKWIFAGIGCMAVSTSVTMAVPAAFGYIIDIATGAKAGWSLSQLSVVFSSLFITGGVFNAMRVYCFTRTGHNIVRRIRHRLFDNITRQEIAFFDRTSTGELINRLSSDTAVMGESLGGLQLSALLRSLAQIAGSFSVMMYLSPELTQVMTAIIPFGMLASIGYGRFVRDTQQKTQDALSESTAFAEEKLLQIRTVRYFANEQRERLTYFDKINKVYDLAMLQTKGSSVFFGSTGAIGNVFLLAVLLYGAHLVQAGVITSGLLTSCLLYSVYIAMSAVNITSSFAGIMRGIGASTRVFQLMDRESEIANEVGLEILHSTQHFFRGDINFKNVCFRYPTRSDAVVLNDFTLSVSAGKAIAIVGESGSGKSTIISLLLRFYDAQRGEISIDGFNLKDLKPDFIRRQIGVVGQEPVLFSGTIRENILYGLQVDDMIKSDENGEELMYKVAKQANAHDFIMDFPAGYDTMVGEGGTNLSGGQKQRIAIARALIKKPSILLLDEATSALDSASEQLVADALQKSMKQSTTIVIAHRLSTIKHADMIAVLNNGQVVEVGTHSELMQQQDSYYASLVQRQLY